MSIVDGRLVQPPVAADPPQPTARPLYSARLILTPILARFEQYELWEFNHGRWELVASFRDFEIANVLAHRRQYRVRLMHVVYEGNTAVQQDVLSEIGAT